MLEDLIRKIKDLDGSHDIPLSELFTDEFVLLNTDFSSISEMIAASGFFQSRQVKTSPISPMTNGTTMFASILDLLLGRK